MNYRSSKIIQRVCNTLAYLAALALLILPRTLVPEGLGIWSHVLLIGALALILVGAVVKAVFYRCPYCKELLPVREKNLKVCPHCKQELKK